MYEVPLNSHSAEESGYRSISGGHHRRHSRGSNGLAECKKINERIEIKREIHEKVQHL